MYNIFSKNVLFFTLLALLISTSTNSQPAPPSLCYTSCVAAALQSTNQTGICTSATISTGFSSCMVDEKCPEANAVKGNWSTICPIALAEFNSAPSNQSANLPATIPNIPTFNPENGNAQSLPSPSNSATSMACSMILMCILLILRQSL